VTRGGRAAIAPRAAAVLAVALAAGCGPAVLWSGHTPDRRHRIEVIEEDGIHWVLVDGRRRSGHRAIAAWTIAASEDGEHIAYAARRGESWVVVHDGRPGQPWDGVGEIALGPAGHLAHAAESEGRWRVVVDGRPGPPFEAILAGTLRLVAAPGGGVRAVYAARSRRGVHVVVDGEVGPAWSGVGQLAVSADGAAVAYAARRGRRAHVVVGGAIGPPADAIARLTLAPRGGQVAYAARSGSAWRVIAGGEESGPYDEVRAIAFSPDGARVAWIARAGYSDLVVEGGALVESAPAIRGDSLAFAAGGELVYAVRERGGGERVVRGGEAGPRYDEVGPVAVSPDGRRVGYPARRGGTWVVAVDGEELPGGAWVSTPVFSPDGRRVAYLARRKGVSGVFAVVDGRAHRFDLAMDGTLVFSRDGRRWSVLAGDLAEERLYFAVDGVPREPLSTREIYSAAARAAARGPAAALEPGGDLLRAWSQAEADKPPPRR